MSLRQRTTKSRQYLRQLPGDFPLPRSDPRSARPSRTRCTCPSDRIRVMRIRPSSCTGRNGEGENPLSVAGCTVLVPGRHRAGMMQPTTDQARRTRVFLPACRVPSTDRSAGRARGRERAGRSILEGCDDRAQQAGRTTRGRRAQGRRRRRGRRLLRLRQIHFLVREGGSSNVCPSAFLDRVRISAYNAPRLGSPAPMHLPHGRGVRGRGRHRAHPSTLGTPGSARTGRRKAPCGGRSSSPRSTAPP